MADDWIPMRLDLWECPQVVRLLSGISGQMSNDNETRCKIIGALYRTWQLVDMYAEDGILHGYDAKALNLAVGVDNWAENLQHVGWLIIEPQHLVIPDFESWFSTSTKRRKADARRKRIERKPVRVLSETSGQKSDHTTGQDKTIKTPYSPPQGDTPSNGGKKKKPSRSQVQAEYRKAKTRQLLDALPEKDGTGLPADWQTTLTGADE